MGSQNGKRRLQEIFNCILVLLREEAICQDMLFALQEYNVKKEYNLTYCFCALPKFICTDLGTDASVHNSKNKPINIYWKKMWGPQRGTSFLRKMFLSFVLTLAHLQIYKIK
jgi:hypothetical protein